MELDKVQQLQYAVACFKEFSHANSQLSLIWKTDHGFATFDSYQVGNRNSPILTRKPVFEAFSESVSDPSNSIDMFAVTRHLLYNEFNFSLVSNLFLLEDPSILLNQLLDTIDDSQLSGKKGTDSTKVWNVSFLESNVTLPFLDFSFLGDVEPASLVSKSSTDTE